jgi:hypothetical protein
VLIAGDKKVNATTEWERERKFFSVKSWRDS